MNKELVNFEDYTGDFKWDMRLHFPIPTADYLLNRTGTDISESEDSTVKQHAMVLNMVRTAKNYLFIRSGANNENVKKWEYIMAHDINMIYDVLEYICDFINIVYTSGEYENIYKLRDSNKKYNIPALDHAISILPFKMKPIILPVKYYEGY